MNTLHSIPKEFTFIIPDHVKKLVVWWWYTRVQVDETWTGINIYPNRKPYRNTYLPFYLGLDNIGGEQELFDATYRRGINQIIYSESQFESHMVNIIL